MNQTWLCTCVLKLHYLVFYACKSIQLIFWGEMRGQAVKCGRRVSRVPTLIWPGHEVIVMAAVRLKLIGG